MKLLNFFRSNSSEDSKNDSIDSQFSTPLLREESIQWNLERQSFFERFMGEDSILDCFRKNLFTIFSLTLGSILTFYTLRNTMDKEEENLPENIYLSYGFALSGILWRLSWKSNDLVSTNSPIEEKNTEIKKSISSIELSESTPILDEDHIQNSGYQKLSGSFTIRRLGHNVIPSLWFTQTFYLFVKSALNEGPDNYIFPYSTLIGLSSGLLFYLSIQPWSLMGAREWIQKKRNLLSALEFLIFSSLKAYRGSNIPYLFYFLTSSFWGGYNLYDGILNLLGKCSHRAVSSKNTPTATIPVPLHIQPILSRNRQIFSFLSGAGLIASSILLLTYWDIEDTKLRNTLAKLMGAMGCYLSTYPIGVYLGQKINPHYHSSTLFLCTYLLVPFASPGLSVMHYLAMMNGGLCGGIAHFVVTQQYRNRITAMQNTQLRLNEMTKKCSQLIYELTQCILSIDPLLQQHQQQSYKIKRIISLIAFFTAFAAIAFKSVASIAIPLDVIGYLLSVHWLMPKFQPGIYNTKPLSFLSRVLYQFIFNGIFI